MAYLEELLPEFRKVYVLGEVKGNKFHFVTPDGKVLSFAKGRPNWRSPVPDKDGYLCIGIKINGKDTTRKIHRLVAEAFIPNPDNKPEVNHINGIKSDNRLENLEWVASKENTRHMIEVLKHIPDWWGGTRKESSKIKMREKRRNKGKRKKRNENLIQRGCLCWFYNYTKQPKKMAFLCDFDEDYFLASDGNIYRLCRPVRRDEVTFYEDKKDE